MFLIINRIIIGSIFFMITPMSMWMLNWQWQPNNNLGIFSLFFLFTETITIPYGIITHILLCFYFSWYLCFNFKSAFIFFIIITFSIISGQILKSYIKEYTHEHRPFVIWLGKINNISVNQIYNLKNKEFNFLLKTECTKSYKIPNFLIQHWKKEINFSFPSGHTIFAVTWALLGIGLLWSKKRNNYYLLILIIWANIAIESRIILGMHWPHDVVASILISLLLSIITVWIIFKNLMDKIY